jgi:hypothetical protein
MLALCALLAACTHDFGAFAFADEREGGARDARTPEQPPGAGEQAPGTDAGTRMRDAAVPPTRRDAALDLDASLGDAIAPPEPMDGAAEAGADAGPPDTGPPPPDPGPCLEAWTSTPPGPETCRDCACSDCTLAVHACLTEGSTTEQALCNDVLACAIANDCQEWACYCNSPQCGSPGPDGNGPCVAQINAAAGGGRDQVNAIMAAGDPQEPLVRANAAVRCVIGASNRSQGGRATGHCVEPCR